MSLFTDLYSGVLPWHKGLQMIVHSGRGLSTCQHKKSTLKYHKIQWECVYFTSFETNSFIVQFSLELLLSRYLPSYCIYKIWYIIKALCTVVCIFQNTEYFAEYCVIKAAFTFIYPFSFSPNKLYIKSNTVKTTSRICVLCSKFYFNCFKVKFTFNIVCKKVHPSCFFTVYTQYWFFNFLFVYLKKKKLAYCIAHSFVTT